jgi:hypothetical protein
MQVCAPSPRRWIARMVPIRFRRAIRAPLVLHPDWPSRYIYDLPHFISEIGLFTHDHHMSVKQDVANIQTTKYNVPNRQISI